MILSSLIFTSGVLARFFRIDPAEVFPSAAGRTSTEFQSHYIYRKAVGKLNSSFENIYGISKIRLLKR